MMAETVITKYPKNKMRNKNSCKSFKPYFYFKMN